MNCYKCPYRKEVPGSAHSQCHYPLIEKMWKSPEAMIISIYGGGDPIVPTFEVDGVMFPVVVIDPHGIRNGWAMWPYNFDPTWIKMCAFYIVDNMNSEKALENKEQK
jgi:hypothetical protein